MEELESGILAVRIWITISDNKHKPASVLKEYNVRRSEAKKTVSALLERNPALRDLHIEATWTKVDHLDLGELDFTPKAVRK